MAFTPINPFGTGRVNLSSFGPPAATTINSGFTFFPINPIVAITGAGSWAIGLAPLALPFLALLMRWLP